MKFTILLTTLFLVACGTSSEFDINPRGPAGTPGAPGETGPRGPQGPQGSPGTDGQDAEPYCTPILNVEEEYEVCAEVVKTYCTRHGKCKVIRWCECE